MEITSSFSDPKVDNPVPVTVQEEKELRRVFDILCDYQTKNKINGEINDLQAWQDAAKAKVKSHLANNVMVNTDRVEANHEATQARIDELKQQIAQIESNPNRSISCGDVYEMMKNLKQKMSKKEVEEIMWEVDENLDGKCDWNEFKLMFTRNIMDKTGLEPSRMYNLTQFLIYDHNQNGLVSVDETMNMLYARYGRAKMELKLKQIFGEDMHESGREGGEITFPKFLKSIEKVQMQTFWGTSQGRLVSTKGGATAKKLETMYLGTTTASQSR